MSVAALDDPVNNGSRVFAMCNTDRCSGQAGLHVLESTPDGSEAFTEHADWHTSLRVGPSGVIKDVP